ncbi:nucleotidyl transferase AbiEii/AbiGii toxin family protein [Rudanella lutea]|uniref:nucleotidyl transferase AbiEii/AbiGii toxin family protein n=1 Tax=Rudanella lutea TaxID=451374 RepID=UPI00037D071D|nr:nucleotidyl transferase AbiEii/AbiGii toxin family protein [Rudanella lutea]
MHRITFEQLRQGNLGELFAVLESELVTLGVDFYLIGAIARDIWLTALHDIEPGRVTRDLDLAVLLANEEQYGHLRDRLIGTGRFIARRDNVYTLVFEDGRPVDLLPFGALSMEQSVSVAGQGLTTIRVDGFQEVYEAGTESVEIDNQPFLVCTLAGIVLLKFIAYDDRPEHRSKDILDIGAILRHYFDITEDDIYENHNDLFSDDEFDITLTAARVLGRQMAPIVALSNALHQRIDQIIDQQISLGEQSPVAELLVRDSRWSVSYALNLLRQLRRGMGE